MSPQYAEGVDRRIDDAGLYEMVDAGAYDDVAAIAQEELCDRWDIDHPQANDPMKVDVTPGGGTADAGTWRITLPEEVSSSRTMAGLIYEEVAHNLDAVASGRDRGGGIVRGTGHRGDEGRARTRTV